MSLQELLPSLVFTRVNAVNIHYCCQLAAYLWSPAEKSALQQDSD